MATLIAGNVTDALLAQTTQSLATSQTSGVMLILLAFLAGILTSLLPCIYPMIPITLGIIQGQGAQTVRRNFQLTFAYINGLAIVYAMLGYICAKSALLFGSWLGKPWFVIAMTLLFVYLAGSLLGLYELYIPRALQSPITRVEGGSVMHCFILGTIAAFVASPCLAPPLVVLMGLVAQQANPIVGFATLYAFALGMGMLLLAVGTFSGTVAMLPRAGEWLDTLKQCLGFVLLCVAAHFLQPVTGIKIVRGIYAAIVIVAAWFFSYKFYVYQMRQNQQFMAYAGLVAAVLVTVFVSVFFQAVFLRMVGILS
jgi:thiol:disulfide interchange protein DsbD